ncbi:hypothetical protein EVAR_25864_1 [Eumeta japonica]|uniref:Uncharacterized protein n=1 Tax=Eumeta variegata TaxID=151549 RepID=A0A4C1X4X8_EUMVA|nr:hypothetical protein EVAR_25864_1 [Eumeta japonica]
MLPLDVRASEVAWLHEEGNEIEVGPRRWIKTGSGLGLEFESGFNNTEYNGQTRIRGSDRSSWLRLWSLTTVSAWSGRSSYASEFITRIVITVANRLQITLDQSGRRYPFHLKQDRGKGFLRIIPPVSDLESFTLAEYVWGPGNAHCPMSPTFGADKAATTRSTSPVTTSATHD